MCSWQQMVGAVLPQTDGQCAGQSDSKDSVTLSPSFSLSPSSLHPLCVRPMNGWLSLSVSSHAALSSSVSLLVLSFLCKDVRPVYHSLHPSVRPSLCLSDEYLSLFHLFSPSSVHPSILPLCVCVNLDVQLCERVCVFQCAHGYVCVCVSICACQITIYPPIPPSHPLPRCVCGVNQGQWGSVGRHPPSHLFPPYTHTPRGCCAHPAI